MAVIKDMKSGGGIQVIPLHEIQTTMLERMESHDLSLIHI